MVAAVSVPLHSKEDGKTCSGSQWLPSVDGHGCPREPVPQ